VTRQSIEVDIARVTRGKRKQGRFPSHRRSSELDHLEHPAAWECALDLDDSGGEARPREFDQELSHPEFEPWEVPLWEFDLELFCHLNFDES
jgi:hypothetical protein